MTRQSYIGNNPNKTDQLISDTYLNDSKDLVPNAHALYTLFQQVSTAIASSEDAVDKINKLFDFLKTSGVDVSTLLPSFDNLVSEAPIDNNDYTRKNGQWFRSNPVADVTLNDLHFRSAGQWVQYVPPSPDSLDVYTRIQIDNKLNEHNQNIQAMMDQTYIYQQQAMQAAQNVIELETKLDELIKELEQR